VERNAGGLTTDVEGTVLTETTEPVSADPVPFQPGAPGGHRRQVMRLMIMF
jgi:hypothetical protein